MARTIGKTLQRARTLHHPITAQTESLESRRLCAASAIVFPGADGRLVYAPDAEGDVIPDFAMVGYKTGNVPLPNTAGGISVPVKATVNPGAAGVDMTATIQTAINTVSGLSLDANGFRGAVLLTAGNYPISGTLHINASGVVLMGVGDNSTTGTRLQGTGTATRFLVDAAGNASRSLSGSTYTITDSYVPVGARTFHVNSTSGLAVGDAVNINRPTTANWIHDIGMDLLDNPWTVGSKDQNWERTITAINTGSNTVTIDIPLTNALDVNYGGGSMRHYTNPRISQVGISDMYLYSDSLGAGDLAHATGSITMDDIVNGWIHNITSDGFAVNQVVLGSGTKFCTLDDALIQNTTVSTQAPPAGVSVNGVLSLVSNVIEHGVYHAVALTATVAGPNVITNLFADGTGSDAGPHQRWSTGGLFDDVTIVGNDLQAFNRGNSGSGHGWAGANYVFWNSSARNLEIDNPPTAQNWAIGCIGNKSSNGTFESLGANVTPASLYQKQLWDRLHANPTVATPAMATPNPLGASLSTALSVLGADVSVAESTLKYTWTTLSKPAAAANPTFSANGTNAAKNSTATLSVAGTYIFQVTVADAGGLLASSTVIVTPGAATTINGTSGNDVIRVVRNGSFVDVFRNDPVNPVLHQDYATSPELIINGLGGDDTITVDYSGGDPIPAAGLVIDSGAGTGDVIALAGSSGVDAITLAGGSASVNGGQFGYIGAERMDLNFGAGADTLTVSGDSSTTATALVVNVSGGGTLGMTAGSTLPSFTDLNVNGAAFNLSGVNQTIDSLNGSGTVANASGTAATLTVGQFNGNGVFSGAIINGSGGGGAAAFSLTKVGSGKLTLSGANTYTGVSTLSGGVLESGNVGSFAGLSGLVRFDGGTFHVTANTTAAVVSNKFTTGFSGATSASTGTFDIDAGVTLTIGGASACLQTAGGGGSGGGFIKTGAGILRILSNNNQQDDPFTLDQGTISAESANALGGGDSGVRLDAAGGTTLVLKADAGTSFLTPLNIADPGGAVNVVIDRMNSGAAVTHSLNTLTSVGAFTLNVSAGAGVTSGAAGLTLGSIVMSGDGTISVGPNAVVTVSGAMSGAFGLIKTGTGSLVLGGTNTYTTTTISAGTLQLGLTGASGGTLGSGNVTDNAMLVFNRGDAATIANVIGGSGAVQQTGGAALTLSGANTYAGATTVAAGRTLNVTGSLSATNVVNANGTVNFAGNAGTGPFTRALGAINIGAGGRVNVLASAFPATPAVMNVPGVGFADVTAKLDLANNELISSAPASSIRARIIAGQIFTSSAGGVLGYLDLGGAAVEVRFTFAGDTNLDGTVNATDLGNLASNYGAASGGTWANGDFDYNNAVDVIDLGDMASHYGTSLATGTVVAALPQAVVALNDRRSSGSTDNRTIGFITATPGLRYVEGPGLRRTSDPASGDLIGAVSRRERASLWSELPVQG